MLVNGQAVWSCTMPVTAAVGKKIVTLDGLGTPERPHPVQQAFIDEQAFQCGYCMNGWVLVSKVLLVEEPVADRSGHTTRPRRAHLPVRQPRRCAWRGSTSG